MSYYDYYLEDFKKHYTKILDPYNFPTRDYLTVKQTTKFYAISTDFAKDIYKCCKNFEEKYNELGSKIEKNDFLQCEKLPTFDFIEKIADKNKVIKKSKKENRDYVLISKKNKKWIYEIYKYLNDDFEKVKLPIVYVAKKDKTIVREYMQHSVNLKIKIEETNNREHEVEQTVEMYLNVTIKQAKKAFKNAFEDMLRDDYKIYYFNVDIVAGEDVTIKVIF